MERVSVLLPQGSSTMCFDKEEFVMDFFDVDIFVCECRKHLQMDNLRDDLELYYRLLKSAMVELINQDYADFVNLSTNLVGMDKALSQLSVPLGQLREEILSLKTSVTEVVHAVDDLLDRQEDTRAKRMCVLRMTEVIHSVEKIEKILYSKNCKETTLEHNSSLFTGQILERIATEFNLLQFHAVQSKGMPFLDTMRPRIAGITALLQQSLESLMLEGLQTTNMDIVRHCLRTYATVDKTRDAEALVGQVLVKPYVDEVIMEHDVQSHPDSLQAMYNKFLEFVPHHCHLLQEVTGVAVTSEKTDMVPGYDFLVNSVWPEIARGLEIKLPSLFNPGNPELFLQKYIVSMNFVRKFERQCASQASIKRLRSHPSYHSFNSKWNLPVYFQLRFKEIAGALESALIHGLEKAPAESKYGLYASHVLWSCLTLCWSDKVFLPLLAHRFWKLTIQLIMRYCSFIMELVFQIAPDASNCEYENVTLFVGAKNDQVSELTQDSQMRLAISTHDLILLVADVEKIKDQMPELLEILKPKLQQTGFKNMPIIEGALDDMQVFLSPSLLAIKNKIVLDIGGSCFAHLKCALEVPRLYRRTNKEIPKKPSSYVDNALKPLFYLQNQCKNILKQSIREELLIRALCICTPKYYDTLSDVLSSLKKMEESLKRLKQARKTAASSVTNRGNSDDHKIRLQLALDVDFFSNQVQNLGLRKDEIESFQALTDLVYTAKEQAIAE